MLLLLDITFMLSVVKLLLKGEVGVCALNSHGIVFLNFCGNTESNPLRCIDIISGKKNEIMKCGICVANPLSADHNKSHLPLSSAEIFTFFWHTVYFQIRRLLYEQAELGPQCLP